MSPVGRFRTAKSTTVEGSPRGGYPVRRRRDMTCIDKTDERPILDVGRSVLSDSQWCLMAESLNLSPRELEVVLHVLDGDREAVIAEQMGISRHTVHSYLERIYHKLHVASRCQLVVRIFQEHVSHEAPILTGQ